MKMFHDNDERLFSLQEIKEDDIDSDVLSESDEEEVVKDTNSEDGDEDDRDDMDECQQSAWDMNDGDVAFLDGYEDEEDGDGEALDMQSFNEEEEQYKQFLRSVKFHDDSNLGLDESFLMDEDGDEEDYQPDAQDDNSDTDDDEVDEAEDDDVGDEFLLDDAEEEMDYAQIVPEGSRVRPKELKELLGDCWLTIAGEGGEPRRKYPTPKSNNKSTSLNTHSLLSSLMSQLFSGQKSTEATIDDIPVSTYRKIVARQMSMALQLLIQILLQAEDKSTCFTASYQQLLHLNNERTNAVKKAALLQMNMESILAMKQQGNTADQSTKSKIIKRNQIQQLMEEVVPHLVQPAPSTPQQQQVSQATVSQPLPSGRQTPTVPLSNRILTRSSLINYNSQSQRSSSILDVPILSQIGNLLQEIDLAQKRFKTQILQFAIQNNLATVFNNQICMAENASQHPLYREFLLETSHLQVEHIFRAMNMTKVWQAAIPSRDYPFQEAFCLHFDPSSVAGKTYFTPAEEDLMLRSILRYGDVAKIEGMYNSYGILTPTITHNPWHIMHVELFPLKDPQLLEYHYHQRTLVTAPPTSVSGGLNQQHVQYSSNPFKRFQWMRGRGLIVPQRQREDRWQHSEDLNLLRGFQVCGHRWLLLTKLFLPHRRAKDVRNRWNLFLKIWSRAFPDFDGKIHDSILREHPNLEHRPRELHRAVLDTMLTPKVAVFLQDLQLCRDFRSLLVLQSEGGRHMRALDGIYDPPTVETPVSSISRAKAHNNMLHSQVLQQQNRHQSHTQLQQLALPPTSSQYPHPAQKPHSSANYPQQQAFYPVVAYGQSLHPNGDLHSMPQPNPQYHVHNRTGAITNAVNSFWLELDEADLQDISSDELSPDDDSDNNSLHKYPSTHSQNQSQSSKTQQQRKGAAGKNPSDRQIAAQKRKTTSADSSGNANKRSKKAGKEASAKSNSNQQHQQKHYQHEALPATLPVDHSQSGLRSSMDHYLGGELSQNQIVASASQHLEASPMKSMSASNVGGLGPGGTIDDMVLGFSNFTRDLSMMRAVMLHPDASVHPSQSGHPINNSSSNQIRGHSQSSNNEISDSSGGASGVSRTSSGLFASVMRGAN